MLHLSSHDVASGPKYNGTYNFTKSIFGNFSMIYQYLSNFGNVPWVYEGCNSFYIVNNADYEQFTIVEFPEMVNDDSASVIAWFTAGIATTGWVTVTSGSYDASLNQYTFEFSIEVLIRYAVEDSTIAYVFNWVYADPITPLPTTSLTIDARYINNSPRILELHCEQIQSQAINANGDKPTLFLSTQDSFISNQEIQVNIEVTSLTIQIYRPSNHGAPLPITDDFELIFKPI